MDLKRMFLEAQYCDVIKVDKMVMDRKYPIVRAKRVNTKFGGPVLLTIENSPEQLVKVFLPNRYSVLFTDDEMECINSNYGQLNLIYKGTCQNTKSHKLRIEHPLWRLNILLSDGSSPKISSRDV